MYIPRLFSVMCKIKIKLYTDIDIRFNSLLSLKRYEQIYFLLKLLVKCIITTILINKI